MKNQDKDDSMGDGLLLESRSPPSRSSRSTSSSSISSQVTSPLMSKTERGAMYERLAQDFLEREGLECLDRNVRLCGAELDIVMRDRRGVIVFVEVRARRSARFGGAAASIDWKKRVRIRRAATAWLSRWRRALPPCRFDVIAIESGEVQWLRDAFGEND